MNWRTGFFRIWVVISVVWISFFAWDIYDDDGRQILAISKKMRDLEPSNQNLSMRVERRPIPKGREVTYEELKESECLQVNFNSMQSRVWFLYCDLPAPLRAQIDRKKIAPNGHLEGEGQMHGINLEDARAYVLETEKRRLSERLTQVFWKALLVILPPLGLIGVWFLILWIVRGFRLKS